MVVGGMHGCGGCAWLWGACVVVGEGACMVTEGGGVRGIPRDTVRILLECILVLQIHLSSRKVTNYVVKTKFDVLYEEQ